MTIEDQIKNLDKQKEDLEKKIEKRNAKRKIQCKSCGEKHRICDLDAIQTHYYHSPYGCTGGDYWTNSDIHFICPNTGKRNRMLFWQHNVPRELRSHYVNDPEEQFRRNYKHHFKSVEDEYEVERVIASVNNEYVNDHLKMFGLSIQDVENDC